jgi:hypothetical protein
MASPAMEYSNPSPAPYIMDGSAYQSLETHLDNERN